ncbi:ABC transporter permease [Streptomyces sp. NBC_01795]|uniref:ABC transporter permease n=1 Tax=unclassified Streptomyces TaxID=2593676 RepID=UPI002DDA3BCD|nr:MULTISPECIES: ABC transporter permease [unclassified Streptomyces]WSA90614.1 ABC transporter permease [Streptomyces sp. NBC_01795]WSS16779.1 ABC transporter permease [Streptomyces sp. NBC_01186]
MILDRARRVLLVAGLPAVLLTAWWFATRDSTSVFWPPLADILRAFGPTWLEGRLTSDVVPSLLRLAAGYGAVIVVGVALGTAIGSSRVVREVLEPVLEFLRAVPAPVLVPVIMLFAGIDNTMKISVIAFGCVWPVLLNTVEGVRSVDEVLRDTGRTYRLGRLTTLTKLTLPGASPQIMTGARQALSIGIILMVISEMFAATNGLGFTTIQFQRTFAIPQMWTGIILLGIIGVLLSLLFKLAERRILHWYLGIRHTQRKA